MKWGKTRVHHHGENGYEIQEEQFLRLFRKQNEALISAVDLFIRKQEDGSSFCRPLLGRIHAEARQNEELLDSFSAKKNVKWSRFRELNTVLIHFSNAGYILLHIKYSFPHYRLPEVEGDFIDATDTACAFISEVLYTTSQQLCAMWEELGFSIPVLDPEQFQEWYPVGSLTHDRETLKAGSAADVVTRIATSFLNLTASCRIFYSYKKCEQCGYDRCITDPISEESLRLIEDKFHSLQSRYDTYVAETNVETYDPNLKVLRGHITIIYHMLEAAISLVHYCQRHILPAHGDEKLPVDKDELLKVIMEYLLGFSIQYLIKGKVLSQSMLKVYAEKGSICVPIPPYRGFHVRPSTLIVKIVHHYGSNVKMELDNESYDAGVALELFRANEKINQIKRKSIGKEISEMSIVDRKNGNNGRTAVLHKVIMDLVKAGEVIIYEQPLQIKEFEDDESITMAQYVTREINRLFTFGKLDVESEIKVTFTGDKRVLDDIRLLAGNGYGEDAFGNNIPLPDRLSYLRPDYA